MHQACHGPDVDGNALFAKPGGRSGSIWLG